MKSARIYPKRLIGSTLVVLLSLLALLGYLWSQSLSDLADKARSPRPASTTAQHDRTNQARVGQAYGKLPLSFEINQGQTNPNVKFISRGGGYSIFLTANEAVFALRKNENPQSAASRPQSATLRMKLVGATPQPRVTGLEELPGKVNYFIGNDPKKWRSGITTYARVKYHNVYPRVDLVYYGNQRRLEYDFILKPGADPHQIRLRFDGAKEIRIDEAGDLVLTTEIGDVRQHKPVVYQEVDGSRKGIEGSYSVSANQEIGFEIGSYDVRQPLMIDPVLSYSTYLAGDSHDGGIAGSGVSVKVDASGNAYVAGYTNSTNFPMTPGAFQTVAGSGGDTFVTKLNPTGTSLVYSTYIGGTGVDAAFDVAVDGTGNVYVTGGTNSTNFPVTPGAFQMSYNGGSFSAFVTKLNPAGAALAYSTYLGGSSWEQGNAIRVDATGSAYVTGATASANFPTTPGAFQTAYGGNDDCFVTKLNPTGTALVYSTYIGGSFPDIAYSIAVDASDNAYVTGQTASTDFPTTPGAFQTAGSGFAFVTKLIPTGTALAYSTYLGGSRGESGRGIAVDAFENAYVTGHTVSFDFPTTPGAFQTTYNGGSEDSFITKLNPAGTALVYSTYIGGGGSDQANGIAVDAAGNAFVTGNTDSTNFPIANCPFQSAKRLDRDAFVTKLNSTGTALAYSTYLGADSSDYGVAIAMDTTGNAYVAGFTFSTNFPTTPGAFQTVDQTSNGNNSDIFVAKISDATDTTPPSIICPANISVAVALAEQCSANINPGAATATDNCSVSSVAGVRSDGQALSAPYPLGATTITWKAMDAAGNMSACSQTVTVTNLIPVVTITNPSSGAIYAVGTPVNFNGSFTDNPGGTHTATWMFDTITQPVTVVEPVGSTPGSANASYTFTTQGVYAVKLTVNDSCGGTGEATTVGGFDAMVVVYDPNGGFVTGGGWINSPAGAYMDDPSLTGKANFGFVSKYQNGASVPTGNTEFQFKGGNLNFKSTAYEWMVVAGKKAQYKGSGLINGTGDYRFLLTVIDGQQPGGGGQDKFRIRIWNNSGGGLVYDNQLSAPDSDDPTTVLGGGSIVIHKP